VTFFRVDQDENGRASEVEEAERCGKMKSRRFISYASLGLLLRTPAFVEYR